MYSVQGSSQVQLEVNSASVFNHVLNSPRLIAIGDCPGNNECVGNPHHSEMLQATTPWTSGR